jgi:hypothetical protein
MLHQITETAVEAQDHFKGLTLKAQCETFQDEDLEESFENDPNDTTSWTIASENDKKENTPKKSSSETVVQDAEEYILTEVKREEYCDQPS